MWGFDYDLRCSSLLNTHAERIASVKRVTETLPTNQKNFWGKPGVPLLGEKMLFSANCWNQGCLYTQYALMCYQVKTPYPAKNK
jgi:hypothetical protein